MIVHFRNVNTYEIRGASLFFILDHDREEYALKIIGLSSMEFTDYQDEGFLLGLKNIREHLKAFRL